MGVKNPRFLGHSDDEAFDMGFVQVWPKNGILRHYVCQKSKIYGHSDDEAFDKVELAPLATLGFFCASMTQKWHLKT